MIPWQPFFFIMKHFALCILLLASSCQARPSAVNPVKEDPKPSNAVRGVWITNVASQVLYSPKGIQDAVNLCHQQGINHIFVVVWNKGKTLYPSQIMADSFQIPIEEGLRGRDPLREMINAAHAKNIKVFAWFEYGFAAENSGFGEHILRLKPYWASLDRNGATTTKNNFKWMNALNSEVQNFVLSLVLEVAQKYPDLDGIQGDDRLPAMPSEGGYNPEVLAQYFAETGLKPTSDKEEAWVNWRAGKLTEFMGRLYKEVKKTNPKLVVSMSPSIFPFAKTEYLQDWPTWVQNEWVDLICPQVYRYNLAAYQQELTKITQSHVPKSQLSKVAPGMLLKIGSYSPTPELLKQMIQENRRQGVAGEVFFFYEGLKSFPTFFTQEYPTTTP